MPSDPVRILLVEDEPLISMMTAEMLEDAGFVAEEAATAGDEGAHDGSPYWLGGGPARPGRGLWPAANR